MGQHSNSGLDHSGHAGQNVAHVDYKSVEDRHDRLKFDGGFRIAEKYLQGRLGVIVQFKAPLPEGGDDRPAVMSDNSRLVWRSDTLPVFAVPVRTYNYAVMQRGQPHDGVQNRMFVPNIEVMEDAEVFAHPVWVSLNPDQEVFGILSRCFYSFTRSFVASPASPTVDGKLGASVLLTSVHPHEFPVRMVKRGVDVMNCVPEDKAALGFSLPINNDGRRASVRLELYARSVRVVVEGDLQVADVLLGPVNL